MKRILIAIIMALLVCGFSSISFATSDRAIEKMMIEHATTLVRNAGLNDVVKEIAKADIVAHSQKKDTKGRNVQWVTAVVSLQSKKWGKYSVAMYVIIVEMDSSLKHAKSIGSSIALEHNPNIAKYEYDLAYYKALTNHYGDETKFVIAMK